MSLAGVFIDAISPTTLCLIYHHWCQRIGGISEILVREDAEHVLANRRFLFDPDREDAVLLERFPSRLVAPRAREGLVRLHHSIIPAEFIRHFRTVVCTQFVIPLPIFAVFNNGSFRFALQTQLALDTWTRRCQATPEGYTCFYKFAYTLWKAPYIYVLSESPRSDLFWSLVAKYQIRHDALPGSGGSDAAEQENLYKATFPNACHVILFPSSLPKEDTRNLSLTAHTPGEIFTLTRSMYRLRAKHYAVLHADAFFIMLLMSVTIDDTLALFSEPEFPITWDITSTTH